MDAKTNEDLLHGLNDAQNMLFDSMNNLPASDVRLKVTRAHNLIGQAIATVEKEALSAKLPLGVTSNGPKRL